MPEVAPVMAALTGGSDPEAVARHRMLLPIVKRAARQSRHRRCSGRFSWPPIWTHLATAPNTTTDGLSNRLLG